MEKLIIEARINEYASRGGNPHVPWTATEIGRDAAAVAQAGAAIVHFHARAADGAPDHATSTYAAILRAIRAAAPGLLVHPTLGQITQSDPEQRIAHILELARTEALRPEFASLDLGSTNIDVFEGAAAGFRSGDRTYVNTHGTLRRFLRAFRAAGVAPALACWSIPFLRTLGALLETGEVAEPGWVLLVHTEGGILGGHPATEAGLRAFLDHLPAGRRLHWAVCCKEGDALPLAERAIALGGHVAIGIGDWSYPNRATPTNADLVAEVAALARRVGREVASPAEARAMLGLQRVAA
ncbi:3-keto-5-aminohexanoate cleavage protein [Falsiroseomonas sp. E2-1-a20]|uniref:3-keto-5-aminohexanoate cleavage protein n=1 Tax=Falsiroseomonas sp. E2-1-a20 TaxID=3239300 RepID=UPI003F2DBF4C